MQFRNFVTAGLLGLAAIPPAKAATVAANAQGNYLTEPGIFYMGQSFTVEGSGQFTNIELSFFSTPSSPEAPGTAYLYGSAFTGTPAQLGTGADFLGSAAGVSGIYNFGASLQLTAGTKYFAYVGSVNPVMLYGVATSYAGGEAYQADNSTGLKFNAISSADYRFGVIGVEVQDVSAVPEPASWALLIIGFGMIGAATRRRVGTTVSFG